MHERRSSAIRSNAGLLEPVQGGSPVRFRSDPVRFRTGMNRSLGESGDGEGANGVVHTGVGAVREIFGEDVPQS